ncbi:MAG: hypothetical protein QXQ46_06005 [Thermoplasmatales archaeon]
MPSMVEKITDDINSSPTPISEIIFNRRPNGTIVDDVTSGEIFDKMVEAERKEIRIYALKPAACNPFNSKTVSFYYIDSNKWDCIIKKITLYEDDLLPRWFYTVEGSSLQDLVNEIKKDIEHTMPTSSAPDSPKINYPTIRLWRKPSFTVKPANIKGETARIIQKSLEKVLHDNLHIPSKIGIASLGPYGNPDNSTVNDYIRKVVME